MQAGRWIHVYREANQHPNRVLCKGELPPNWPNGEVRIHAVHVIVAVDRGGLGEAPRGLETRGGCASPVASRALAWNDGAEVRTNGVQNRACSKFRA